MIIIIILIVQSLCECNYFHQFIILILQLYFLYSWLMHFFSLLLLLTLPTYSLINISHWQVSHNLKVILLIGESYPIIIQFHSSFVSIFLLIYPFPLTIRWFSLYMILMILISFLNHYSINHWLSNHPINHSIHYLFLVIIVLNSLIIKLKMEFKPNFFPILTILILIVYSIILV